MNRILPLVVTLAIAGAAHAGDQERSGRLEGTWLVTVTLTSCATGEPIGSPFVSMLSFGRGGVLVETTANPAFFPAVRSAGHGIWTSEGGESYRASSTAFISRDGVLVQTQTISQNIEMASRDEFFSVASIEFRDPSGALVRTGCATASARRYR